MYSNDGVRQRRASMPLLPSASFSSTKRPPNSFGGRDHLRNRIVKFLSRSNSKVKNNFIHVPEHQLYDSVRRCSTDSSKSDSVLLDQTGSPTSDQDFMENVYISYETLNKKRRPSFSSTSLNSLSSRSYLSNFNLSKIKRSRRGSVPVGNISAEDLKVLKKVYQQRSASSSNISQVPCDRQIDSPPCNRQRTINVTLPSGQKEKVCVSEDVSIRCALEDVVTMEAMTLDSYRVLLSSTRAIVDLDVEVNRLASGDGLLLEDDNVFGPDEIDNEAVRLKLTRSLYRMELHYQEDIRSVFDIYAEPLRKFSSLSKEDHQALFVGIEPVLSLSAMLCRKLEDCIRLWDPGSTKLGSLFSKQFWLHYEEYCSKFKAIRKLLEEKKKHDQEFVQFCHMRQGAAKYSLDALLVRPVQRIPDYEQYLCSLLAETDPAHPDYDDLNKAVAKVKNMVKERQEEITIAENEHKMEGVQHRFPNDDLQLQEQSKTLKRSLQHRRRSAPGGLLLKSIKVKHHSSSSGLDVTKTPPLMPDQSMASRTSLTHSPNRTYILEGPVQLLVGLQSMERYLFLFNDLLLVAKQKSSTTFKLKERVRVCEMWTGSCLEDICELSKGSDDRAFVLGWPTCNFVASFDDAETKNTWFAKLTENIEAEKEKEQPKTVVIKILNKEMENAPSSKSMNVGHNEDAEELVKRCMEQFHITKGDAKDYQLWFRSGKDSSGYPLIGHEKPYSIKASHARDAAKAEAGGAETPIILDQRDLNDNTAPNLQFELRETKKSPAKLSMEENQRKKSKVKKSPISNFFRRRQRDPSPSAAPLGKLFGHPLAHICEDDNELPKPIYDMLHYLYATGPFTPGIMRKPANQKCVKDLKEKLDNGEDVSWEDTNPVIVSSTLKEFLRSLPDCLLLSELYPMWLSTVDIDNMNEHIKCVQHVCLRLPSRHNALLRHLMCVLYQISARCDENGMNAYNLAVCISQSLLWNSLLHDSTTDLAQQSEAMEKVPKIVHFLIDHCVEVFGEDTVRLFGEPPVAAATPATKQRDSSTDSDSMNSLLSGHSYPPNGNERRDNSSVDSLDPYSEYSPGVKTHLSPTNLSRDSGLFSSDTQLNEDYSSELDTVSHAASRSQQLQQQPRSGPVLRTLSHETGISHGPAMLLQPGSHHSSHNPAAQSFDSVMDTIENQSCSDPHGGYLPKGTAARKIVKRKGEPVQVSDAHRMPTVHSGVELRTDSRGVGESSAINKDTRKQVVRTMPKRSNDSALGSSLGSSLGSVEESSETSYDEFQDLQNRQLRAGSSSNDIGLLRKSESGAKLFYDETLLHAGAMQSYPQPKMVTATNQTNIQPESDIPIGAFHGSIKRKNTEKSNQCSSNSPPSTRHSWGGILDSHQQQEQKQHAGDNTRSSHNVTGYQTRNHAKSVELRSGSAKSVKSQNKFRLSPADSLEEETEDEFLRLTTNDVKTAAVANTSKLVDTTKVSTQVKAPPPPKESKSQPNQSTSSSPTKSRNPNLRDIKSQSLDCTPHTVYAQYSSKGQTRHSMNSVNTAATVEPELSGTKLSPRDNEILKGMTQKGSDLFPNKVKPRSLKVVPAAATEESYMGSLSNSYAIKASVHHSSSSPRSKSAPRSVLDYDGHIPQSAKLVKQLRNENKAAGAAMERSSSDTRLAQQFVMSSQGGESSSTLRPENPPSYQEAMKRKQALYKQKIPDDQMLQQKEASARARKLYEDSQKKYIEEQKQKEYAYFSEPEVVIDSRESGRVVRKERQDLGTVVKAPPSYEIACKRSERFKEQRRKEQGSPVNSTEIRNEKHHQRDSREGTPVKKNNSDCSSRDSTPVQSISDDREKTPTPQDMNVVAPPTGVGERKKRNKSRERREGQRLSDTRLENSRKKKKGPGVFRSKSDSSEHKLTQLRSKVQDHGDSTDSDEEWSMINRPRRVTKSVDRTASKEKLNGAVDIPLHKSSRAMKERPKSVDAATLLRKLQESGMDVIDTDGNNSGRSIHSRHNIRKNTTVKNKDWHKELAEQYGFKINKQRNQPLEGKQRPQMHFKYNCSLSVDDEATGEETLSEQHNKKRWVPPVHPSKDLVVLNNSKTQGNFGKDYNLNRSSSNVTANKKQKSYLSREMRSNTVASLDSLPGSDNTNSGVSKAPTHTSVERGHSKNSGEGQKATYVQHAKVTHTRSTPGIHDRHSDSAPSTNSEREDSDIEDCKGLSWSVSKLRNLYDANNSSQLQNAHTAAKANSSSHPGSSAVKGSSTGQWKNVTANSQSAGLMSTDTGVSQKSAAGSGEVIYLHRKRGNHYSHESVNPNAEKQYV